MKSMKITKRILSLLLVSIMILSACACASGNEGDGSDTFTGSDSSFTPNGQISSGTDILLSGTPSFRIVYSSAYRTLAQNVSKKLIGLDKSYVSGSGKYATALDTTQPADGTPEIIIGVTKRDATTAAKKLISGKTNYYAIYVTDTAIAVYATSKTGVEAGVNALLKKISAKNGAVVYDNSKGNITGKYTPPATNVETEKKQVDPISKTTAIAKTDIDATKLLNDLKNAAGSKAYSVAVSSTDGIQVASIRNTNAQNTYSVSKVFCVTAIGMLYDEGKIKPTDTIGNIFKDELKTYGITDGRWNNITIHDVMKHNVGFKEGGLLDIDVNPGLMNQHDDFLKVTLSYSLDGKKTHKYTDAAYYLISRVVAKVSGQKLDVYLKSRLFDKADYKDYKITKCPQGHPIGATQFYLRPDDVVKLGRIYLDGGTYNGKRIISQDWVNQVIDKGYELNSSNNGYGKGGMRGQYLYVNYKHNVAVAWLSETDGGTSNLGGKLKSYMT